MYLRAKRLTFVHQVLIRVLQVLIRVHQVLIAILKQMEISHSHRERFWKIYFSNSRKGKWNYEQYKKITQLLLSLKSHQIHFKLFTYVFGLAVEIYWGYSLFCLIHKTYTVWQVTVFRVFLVRIVPHLDWIQRFTL